MAASTHISLEQYFRTHYEGECELLAGELRPKPMGTRHHAWMQARLRDLLRRYEMAGADGKFSAADVSVMMPELFG